MTNPLLSCDLSSSVVEGALFQMFRGFPGLLETAMEVGWQQQG